MAATGASPGPRNEQLVSADQITCRQSGVAAPARTSSNGLERGCKLRIELHRFPRRFAEPFPASLHTTDKAPPASKTGDRFGKVDTACRRFGTEAQSSRDARP